jgi:hypothetical protein
LDGRFGGLRAEVVVIFACCSFGLCFGYSFPKRLLHVVSPPLSIVSFSSSCASLLRTLLPLHAAKIVQKGQQLVVHFFLYPFLGLLAVSKVAWARTARRFLPPFLSMRLHEPFFAVFPAVAFCCTLSWQCGFTVEGAGREGYFDAFQLFAALFSYVCHVKMVPAIR